MVLRLNHFDTKTNLNTGIQEKLENTLAEYLFPGVEFSIGTAYTEATIPSDLQEHNGMTLQFSAGSRMFFANDPTIRDSLYPNPSDGAAYPLPFTPCRTFHSLRNVRILVIDDTTGENGGVIANSDARKLVGDCKGLIDKTFAASNNIEPRAFQFRLGIRPQEESPVMRIAKGTLAPAKLDKFGESFFRMGGNTRDGTLRSKVGYDMVLATSCFKGRKGEDAIKPGEYMLSVGLGVKALALYREHSLGTQILVNYPSAVKKEILPIIKQQAEQLAHDQKDLRRLAQRYVETYERRKALLAKSLESNFQEDINDKFSIFDSLDSGGEVDNATDGESLSYEQKDLLLYSLLKNDLFNYCQLLEHPKIITELQEFARKEWVEIATGRSIKFTSGLAQPNLDLQHNEICVPTIDDGEEIIVTRSPLINSNGVITLKNKHLPEMLNGCVYIHPKTAMDNMQCDFDGDLLAFAASKSFPHLAREVKEKNLAHNRYPDIVKKAKAPYIGTFEQIAVDAMSNKIGIIANEIQKNIASQCEICAMPQTEKLNYLKQVSIHFSKVLQKHQQGKLKIPDKILQKVKQVTDVKSQQTEEKLHLVKNLLKDCVAELGNELQIATDGAKSALRPDNSIIAYCQAITDYKEVEWISDKKNSEAFTNRGMKSNSYSPIDLMIQQTNQIFEQRQLHARPIEQFKKLYPEIGLTDPHKEQAQTIKTEYNSLIKQRITLEDRKKLEPGPYLVITSPTSGKQLEITNLIKFDVAKNPQFWKASELNIRLQSRAPSAKMPHSLKATAKYFDADGQAKDITIGTISMKSMKEHDLKPGMSINQGKVEFHFGISDGMIDALKQQTTEYVESIRNSTPEPEKLQLAAAIHDITHTEESKNYQGLKRAGVAFAIFPNEVVAQLRSLQFTNMRVIGAQFNECAGINFRGEQLAIKFEDGINPRDPTKTARWVTVEGKKLGTIDARSPQLIAGCSALATITSSPNTSIIVTSLKNPNNKLQIDNTDRYAFAGRDWQAEQTNITFNVQQRNTTKAPVVIALLGNQALGVLNKQSANFLQSQLAKGGKTIQGLTITGIVNNAPASYADIVIDPESVKLPDIQANNNQPLVAKVVFFEATVDSNLQPLADQMMCNMLLRAVDRAIERGYDTIHFVDISPHHLDNPSPAIKLIQELGATRKDINIEYFDVASPKEAIANLTEPDDIALGIRSKETINIIGYTANQGKPVAAYIPETGKFDRYNLPPVKKALTATKTEIERDV
ncbi:hypothetical protein DSM106972_086320 [Dulcicalothrix desertica PCC 7102]|uniref:Uncharacterized protein n=1 Tax=Dulcicalothrix desertica PCC 7102 TaxID=232991 RepID=A0A3S1CQJ1_9CYAN|nr:hypothetical protein [Dulcicalothrix desertica]RUS96609.1 hypothetical protein DSM106972_086320 [Dulcicalothrix desertica PCC 7102]TWH43863.1 hypothetical protein CAL7102_07611 [Dulcicalothrix desertica PCC 7102]